MLIHLSVHPSMVLFYSTVHQECFKITVLGASVIHFYFQWSARVNQQATHKLCFGNASSLNPLRSAAQNDWWLHFFQPALNAFKHPSNHLWSFLLGLIPSHLISSFIAPPPSHPPPPSICRAAMFLLYMCSIVFFFRGSRNCLCRSSAGLWITIVCSSGWNTLAFMSDFISETLFGFGPEIVT